MAILDIFHKVGANPVTKVVNIVLNVILLVLNFLLNSLFLLLVFISIIEVFAAASQDNTSRAGYIPFFHYIVFVLCLLGAALAFFISIIQIALSIPGFSDKIPKVITAVVSFVCSILLLVITTTFFIGGLGQLAVTESWGALKQRGSAAGWLLANEIFIIFIFATFLLIFLFQLTITSFYTVLKFLDLTRDEEGIPGGKTLRPYGNDFVSAPGQQYNIESAM